MSGSEKRNKSKLIALRLTPEEYEAIMAESKAAGLSVSEFLRRACAEELSILRRQRAIRDERLEPLPAGVTVGNATPVEVVLR